MCSCGCNTCETKIQGPLLTEGKVKSLLSEGLQYHIDKKIPLFETVYRIGSDKHLALIKEARKMYSRNVIDLCEEDKELIGTHLGEFGIYEGESVPLDLPMLEQTYSGFLRNPEDPDSEKFKPTGSVSEFREDLRALFGKFKGDLKNPEFIKGVAQIMVNWKSLLRSQLDEAKKLTYNDFIQMVRDDMMAGAAPDEYPSDERVRKDAKYLYNRYLQGASVDELFEAKKKEKKDPPLNKPKRGGSKAYYVYVRDPKTKKIKKVSFGSGGLRAKIKNKEARTAFAARHNCKNKKDRTKAGYWSCNLPRYAPALGLGAKMNTFW
jgi:hypothetical protein